MLRRFTPPSHKSQESRTSRRITRGRQAAGTGRPTRIPKTQTGALVEKRGPRSGAGLCPDGARSTRHSLLGGIRFLDWGFLCGARRFSTTSVLRCRAQEEIFGPVLSVMEFEDTGEALSIANGTRFGLAAAIWDLPIFRPQQPVARELRAGTVWINCFDACDITMPFGGYRESGFGREDFPSCIGQIHPTRARGFSCRAVPAR